jgi:hypothetical protein
MYTSKNNIFVNVHNITVSNKLACPNLGFNATHSTNLASGQTCDWIYFCSAPQRPLQVF